jgi:flagellar basal-body rod protein FlgB
MLDDIASVSITTALSGLSAEQRAIANNIANIETPNYRATHVSFQDSLASAISGGDPADTQFTTQISTETPGQNGNNVDLDTETVDATKTQMQYQLMSTAMTNKFGLIDTVLKG